MKNTARIYEDKIVADMALEALAQYEPEGKYTLVRVTEGWQLVTITPCPPYVPPSKPAPVNEHLISGHNWDEVGGLSYTYPFKSESQKFICIHTSKSKNGEKWIGKSNMLAYEIIGDNVKINFSVKMAKKVKAASWL